MTTLLKKTIIVLGVTAAIASNCFAAEEKTAESTPAPKLKAQTHCPVMGGKIDSTVYTDIQGQRVYHCCPGCSKSLVSDPDKYFKKAAAQGILFENVQTTCPVSGENLEEKEISTDYEGRRIFFCCKKCQSTFAGNPQQYLRAMDVPSESEKQNSDSHSGHEHH